jgi:hypothetical protein
MIRHSASALQTSTNWAHKHLTIGVFSLSITTALSSTDGSLELPTLFLQNTSVRRRKLADATNYRWRTARSRVLGPETQLQAPKSDLDASVCTLASEMRIEHRRLKFCARLNLKASIRQPTCA